jgi:hypothetical protein
MTTENYLVVNSKNIVVNVIVWDGDTNAWKPPEGYTMLVQSTTPALIWQLNGTTYNLTEIIGAGQIGFTWDGTILTTNKPQPVVNTTT